MKKEVIKKEVKEEEQKVKVKEETDKDIDFLNVNKVVGGKQRYL
jgi:septum formation topological specificity factor MinE